MIDLNLITEDMNAEKFLHLKGIKPKHKEDRINLSIEELILLLKEFRYIGTYYPFIRIFKKRKDEI